MTTNCQETVGITVAGLAHSSHYKYTQVRQIRSRPCKKCATIAKYIPTSASQTHNALLSQLSKAQTDELNMQPTLRIQHHLNQDASRRASQRQTEEREMGYEEDGTWYHPRKSLKVPRTDLVFNLLKVVIFTCNPCAVAL